MSALPKIINLRLTKAALRAVPDFLGYADNRRCLVCQAVRRQFPKVRSVSVVPGRVTINGTRIYHYLADERVGEGFGPSIEERIIAAHEHPSEFKSFSITLTRDAV